MAEVRAAVWDLGGVLLDWQPEAYYDAAIGPARRRALFDAVDLWEMNRQVDLGRPLDATVTAWADAHPRWAAEIRAWRDAWPEMVRGEVPGAAAILAELRVRGVPVFALTNFGRETLAMAEARWGVLRRFDRRIVSAELGLAKPDPAIYAALEAATGMAAGALIFADDKAQNVAAARARGWRAHLFTDARSWRRALAEAELLPPM